MTSVVCSDGKFHPNVPSFVQSLPFFISPLNVIQNTKTQAFIKVLPYSLDTGYLKKIVCFRIEQRIAENRQLLGGYTLKILLARVLETWPVPASLQLNLSPVAQCLVDQCLPLHLAVPTAAQRLSLPLAVAQCLLLLLSVSASSLFSSVSPPASRCSSMSPPSSLTEAQCLPLPLAVSQCL